MLVYSASSALPLLVFAALGPQIRRKCPEGFVLTEWARQRYGVVTALYLSFMTLFTLFLYMIAELSAIGQVVSALTGLNGLPAMVVQCVVTTVYTCELLVPSLSLVRRFAASVAPRFPCPFSSSSDQRARVLTARETGGNSHRRL